MQLYLNSKNKINLLNLSFLMKQWKSTIRIHNVQNLSWMYLKPFCHKLCQEYSLKWAQLADWPTGICLSTAAFHKFMFIFLIKQEWRCLQDERLSEIIKRYVAEARWMMQDEALMICHNHWYFASFKTENFPRYDRCKSNKFPLKKMAEKFVHAWCFPGQNKKKIYENIFPNFHMILRQWRSIFLLTWLLSVNNVTYLT